MTAFAVLAALAAVHLVAIVLLTEAACGGRAAPGICEAVEMWPTLGRLSLTSPSR